MVQSPLGVEGTGDPFLGEAVRDRPRKFGIALCGVRQPIQLLGKSEKVVKQTVLRRPAHLLRRVQPVGGQHDKGARALQLLAEPPKKAGVRAVLHGKRRRAVGHKQGRQRH